MNEMQTDFLRMAAPAAIASQRETGVPASVTMAQAILESGWGRTGLALQYNNYFGIKARQLTFPAAYVELPTHEVMHGQSVNETAAFVRYATVADSFRAHGRLLATALRYIPALAVKSDPRAFCAELQKCGYSTNPNYARTLVDLIDEYDLTQYDLPAPANPASAPAPQEIKA
jgi:flagellum-specific peptidoglycan hydrolase FlgJ